MKDYTEIFKSLKSFCSDNSRLCMGVVGTGIVVYAVHKWRNKRKDQSGKCASPKPAATTTLDFRAVDPDAGAPRPVISQEIQVQSDTREKISAFFLEHGSIKGAEEILAKNNPPLKLNLEMESVLDGVFKKMYDKGYKDLDIEWLNKQFGTANNNQSVEITCFGNQAEISIKYVLPTDCKSVEDLKKGLNDHVFDQIIGMQGFTII
jgi:hypothetical protein